MELALNKNEARRIEFGFPWIPDSGDGTYRNPVLYADYSDPDVVRHGDDFYMTASSFNCTPGLPILHSRDLVNWTLIGHAIRNLPHGNYQKVQHGCGVWAPSIRFHAGKFWIFFPTPDEGLFVTTAENPHGPWTEPHLVEAGRGLIDPCPLWDDDGRAYLVHAYAGSRAGIKHRLHVRPMAPDGKQLLGEGRVVFHNPERHPTMEGPKFLKKDGWYYLFAPAGGVEAGWQVALRSRHIYGPYEDRIVLERGSTVVNGPHQGAIVDLPNGQWWFLHFQDAALYGRVIHLQPVRWNDGWPQIGADFDGNGIGEPVETHQKPRINGTSEIAIPQASDEFDTTTPGLQWQWHANHSAEWASLNIRAGWLRLFAQHVPDAHLTAAPNLLLQKFPARSFLTTTVLQFSPALEGDEAGAAIIGKTTAALALRRVAGAQQIVFRENRTNHLLETTDASRIWIRIEVEDGGRTKFYYSTDEVTFIAAPQSFQATAGIWIGAKIGLYCLTRAETPGGYADFDYFRFAPLH